MRADLIRLNALFLGVVARGHSFLVTCDLSHRCFVALFYRFLYIKNTFQNLILKSVIIWFYTPYIVLDWFYH